MEEQEQTLRELLCKIAEERGIDNYKLTIEPTSTEGANFTSVLFKATISSNNEDIHLFAKVACVGDKIRAIAPFKIYETETFFYSDLINTYKRLEDKHNIPEECRFVTPQFYGLSTEYLKEAVVMEDLTKRGYEMLDRFKTIDWNYAQEAMKQLANLHALSMVYSIELPEEFERKTENLKMNTNMEAMQSYAKDMIGRVIACARDDHKSHVEKFFLASGTMEKMQMLNTSRNRVVLAHGDYRTSNLMHKKNEDGSYSIIPTDYQTINRNNPIVDIFYFVFSATDQKFRSQYYKKTLDHYYSELCAALRRFNMDPELIYPRKHFDSELEEVLPYGFTIGVMLLMLVTVEHDKAPKIDDNSDFQSFYVDPSEEYKRRLNELIEDFIAMGVL